MSNWPCGGQTISFIGLNRFRCFFDKADNIAHAENTAGHAFRIKFFQCILFFASTENLIGQPVT